MSEASIKTISDDSGNGLDPKEYSLLIVDNDKAHARAMTESLERVGYRCAVATSGPEGIQQIEKNMFHVVVTD